MIWTVIQTSWRRLRNNRAELALTFIVPMVFFSIFAVIFGSRDSASSTPKIKVALCNEAGSALANRSIELLAEQKSLRITDHKSTNKKTDEAAEGDVVVKTVDRKTAEDLVRRGMVSAAVIFPKPKNAPPNTSDAGTTPTADDIQVMTDSFDQVTSQVLTALVHRSVMTARGELAKEQANLSAQSARLSPTGTLDGNGSAVVPAAYAANSLPTSAQNSAPNSIPTAVVNSTLIPNAAMAASIANEMPSIATVDILGGKKTNPVIAMYAAGIAVMFLLFSATTASGSLLDERENSTLDRLLCSRLTMDQLLLGKWAYLTMIGAMQMTLMFIWGSVVFHIELIKHLEGFIAMTIVTAGAAASFALMLASLCKSRMQLGWVSTIVILTMSALGGSMVPRYLMSETIQRVGMLTFNAWALEGYNKVFWRELPLSEIGMELAVLAGCGTIFIVAARLFAVRWERA